MARQVLNNGDTYGIIRGKINSNFLELYTDMLTPSQVLLRANTDTYTPTSAYHPSTKKYVDDTKTALIQIYDPNGISQNAFSRANHTGQMEAQYITQETDYRFVSDTEKTSWNNKEPGIGAKGTAFNKNFGELVGTVAEGNHNHNTIYEAKNTNIQTHISTVGNPHLTTASEITKTGTGTVQSHIDSTSNPHSVTKTQVGLSNVDNTADVAKISIGFVPQAIEPTYQEGQVFYDDNEKSLVLQTDFSDVKLNIGKENHVRIYNDTGLTLSKGTAVKFNSVHGGTGLPTVVAAIADSFVNAIIFGIVEHDIDDSTEGYITKFGIVKNFDTSAFLTGDLIYLSSTVGGSFVSTAPGTVSIIGYVLISHVSLGSIFVSINNNVYKP